MFGNKKLEEDMDLLRNDLRKLEGKLDLIELVRKDLSKTDARVDKCINYLNGQTKGKIDEKFIVLKNEAQSFISEQVNVMVEQKIIGIMALLVPDKVKSTISTSHVTTPATSSTASTQLSNTQLVDFGKMLEAISKDVKDLKAVRQKDSSLFNDRISKLETDFSESKALMARFVSFFEALEAKSNDITGLDIRPD